METGEIEVVAQQLLVLNDAKLAPFSPAEDAIANEEVRLKYRYIDLRRAEMQHNLKLRHDITLAIRQYLSGEGFLEIETPFMTRSTPEGARDYLVPSRVHAGSFYALPQSPQLFKQILMISGLDRYFQIARCFRDEDLRADRQPEFTQIDLEISFPQQETVFAVVEGFLNAAFAVAGTKLTPPFPRMTFDEALRLYGIDKPDLRLPQLHEVREVFAAGDLESLAVNPALPVVAVHIPAVGDLSRKERDDLRLLYPPKLAQQGTKVFDDFKRLEKMFPEAMAKIRELAGAKETDLLALVAAASTVEATTEQRAPGVLSSRERQIYEGAGAVRLAIAQKYADRHKLFEKKGNSEDYKFLWVTDFPFFEWDEDTKTWTFAHHPFTSPHEDDIQAGRLDVGPGIGALPGLRYRAERHRARFRIDPYSSQRCAAADLSRARHERRRGQGTFRLLPRSPRIWNSSTRRYRARSRPHCHDPRRCSEPAGGHRVSQDCQSDRPDGGCSDASE